MSKKQKKKVFLMFLVLTVIFCFGIAEVFAEANGLFSEVPYSTDLYIKQKQEKPDPTVIRSRYVEVNFEGLASKDIPQGAESISLNLFDDVNLTAVRDRIERRSETQYTWFGRISGVELSQVIIVVENGVMASNITLNGKIYQVRFAGDGIHSIREIDQSKFPEEAPPIPVKTPYTPDSTLPSETPDTGSYIDVMVAYTADARNAAGGTTAMNTQIQLGIDETNQSYSNSGITQRLNLVHRAEVTYTETGDMSTDLDRLRSTSDGYMDNVHTLRNTYGADLVNLWVNNGGGSCGIAYVMTTVSTAFASSGFNVVDRSCATGYYSFGHELGHNMGALHDWYVDSTNNSPYTYNHGYAYPSGAWRTVMAYNNYCTNNGTSCTRVQYWSNPNVTYGGVPMGIAEGSANAADNRKTLNNTAYTVANFRTSSSSCTYTISPTSKSFTSTGGTGSVTVTPSSSSCSWTATESLDWVSITSGSSGTGSGTVNYSVSANTSNTSTSSRTGNITIAGQTFTVTQSGTSALTIGEAVDNTSLTWTTGGNANWAGQTTVSYYGGDAAKSGTITHSQTTWVQTTVTGPGTLSFYWKVSSESGYDYLRFYIDGTEQSGKISGTVDWTQKTYTISSGSHTLKWAYTKDNSESSGSDAGWLDKVVFAGTSCTYTISPTFQTFTSTGGTGSVTVTPSSSSCAWTATESLDWVSITSGSSGTGNGTVSYTVSANSTGATRTGTMIIADQTFTITQTGTAVAGIVQTITPPTTTTVSKGGVLGPFSVTTTNNGTSSSSFSVYVYIRTPDGTWNQIFSNNVTMAAGATNTISGVYLGVPATAPAGGHYYQINLYDTSGNLIDYDGFSFTVSSASTALDSTQYLNEIKRAEEIMTHPRAEVTENEGWKMIIIREE